MNMTNDSSCNYIIVHSRFLKGFVYLSKDNQYLLLIVLLHYLGP